MTFQQAGVCQAIAVIHSRIMEESPNSFPDLMRMHRIGKGHNAG